MSLTATELTPGQVWQNVIVEWQNLAEAAWMAGQDDVSKFLTEISHDAEELCATLGWPVPSVN